MSKVKKKTTAKKPTKKAEKKDDELSDEELSNVSGGAGGVSGGVDKQPAAGGKPAAVAVKIKDNVKVGGVRIMKD